MTQKTKKYLVLFSLVVLGLFLPACQTRASLADDIGKAVGNFLASLIFQLLIFASGILLLGSSWFLGWVTSPSFIGVGFTANPFVTPSWGLMRDLANMGFVIALVAIGLGTALRRGEYQVQRLLPRLIGIALLINFTPVICGVIIDASHIIMNFFLGEGVSFGKAVNDIWAQTQSLWGSISSANLWTLVGMGVAMVAYNVIASIIFFVFACLFAVRYVVLWALIILSPLAFFAYILPDTRKFWDLWWKQFIQWCFIGVTSAFWLYLTEQLMEVSGILTGQPPPSEQFGGISALAAYLIPAAFLWFGALASLTSSAEGATAVISFAKERGKAAIMGLAMGAARGGKRFIREKTPPGVKEAISTLATIETPLPFQVTEAEQKAGVRAWLPRAFKWAIRQPTGLFVRGARRVGEMALPETELREIEKEKERVKKEYKTPAGLLGYLRDRMARGTRGEMIATFTAAYEEKKLKGLEKEGLTEEEVVKIAREAFVVGPEAVEPFLKAYPDLVERMAELATAEKKEKAGIGEEAVTKWAQENRERLEKVGISREAIEAMSPELLSRLIPLKITATVSLTDIPKLSVDHIDKDAIHLFWTGREMSAAAREFGKDFVDTFMREARIRGHEWYEDVNPALLRYLGGQGAQNLGLTLPSKIDYTVTLPPFVKPKEERLGLQIEFIKGEIEESKKAKAGFEKTPEAERTEEQKRLLKAHIERLSSLEEERSRLEELIEKAKKEKKEEKREPGVYAGPGVEEAPAEPEEAEEEPRGRGVFRGPGV